MLCLRAAFAISLHILKLKGRNNDGQKIKEIQIRP